MGVLKVKPYPPSEPKLKVKDAPQEAQPARENGPQRAKKPSPQQEEPPKAPEIEKAVLGGIFQHPEIGFPTFGHNAKRSFFCNKINMELYELGGVYWEANERLDMIGFTSHLIDCGRLEAVGGAYAVTELFTNQIPVDMIDYYIDILREKYVLRKIQTSSFTWAGKVKSETVATLLAEMAETLEYLNRTANSAKDLYDAATVLNGEMPPLPRVVIHHLLHQGSKMILGGTSKSNKTWALMDLSLSVSTGTDWWGFHTNKSRVCYVNLELQDGFFVQRLKSICEVKGVYPEAGWFKILNLRGQAEAIEDLRRHFTTLLRAGVFGLIVIDPVYKVLGRRDENKAGDIATLLNEIEKIASETGAAVVFAAHYSKGNQAGKESMDRIGGSGVFARDPDSVLTMTQHESLDCFTVDATLRNLSPISQFVVHWDYPLFKRDEEQDPHKLRGKAGAKQVWSEKDVLDEFRVGEGWETPKLQKHLRQERGMSSATFYRIWEKLRIDGKIRVDQDGIWNKFSQFSQPDSENTENDEKNAAITNSENEKIE